MITANEGESMVDRVLNLVQEEWKQCFDIVETKRNVQKKITHSYINVWFKDNIDPKDRYEAGRKLKEAASDHEDSRHLKVQTQEKPEDVTKRVAMGKFYSFLKKNSFD